MRSNDFARAFDTSALLHAARRTAPLRGESRPTPASLTAIVNRLAGELATGRWRPGAAHVFRIARPGEPGRATRSREVARLSLEDRIVQRALLTWLQRHTPAPPAVVCAYVPGRGAHGVVGWMHCALRAGRWCGGLDVVDFFPSIDRARLVDTVSRWVAAPGVVELIARCVHQPIHGGAGQCDRGILQGALLSPWLSNLYLIEVDARLPPAQYRRYCDNLFFTANDGPAVSALVHRATDALSALGLAIRTCPPRPRDGRRGIEVLGMHVDARGVSPGRKRRVAPLERLTARLAEARPSAAATLLRGYLNYHRPMANPEDPFMTDLDELDALLRAGRFREAMARIDAIAAAATAAGEDEDDPTPALRGDPERHVELQGPRRRVVSRGLSLRDRAEHVRGERTLGVLPVDRQDRAHTGILDIDPWSMEPEANAAARDVATALSTAARTLGRATVIEDTGGRGFHVWVPYRRPVPRERAVDDLAEIVQRSGAAEAEPDVRVERFPGDTDADPHVRLPGGPHPTTGRRSTVIDLDGRPTSPGARAIVTECRLLGGLCRKAAATGHLDHTERYSLAGVLGHLGAEGHRAVHEIISHCDNYDHETTQGFLDRLAPSPLGCRRLLERHPEHTPCERCPSPRAPHRYPTPLSWAAARGVAREQPIEPDRGGALERLLAGVARSLERVRRGPA